MGKSAPRRTAFSSNGAEDERWGQFRMMVGGETSNRQMFGELCAHPHPTCVIFLEIYQYAHARTVHPLFALMEWPAAAAGGFWKSK